MLKRIEQRFGLAPHAVGRLAHFVFLSISLATANVLAITLAESLFLNKVGAEWLPLFYVLLAVISVPVATGFSQLVDRFRRPVVFRYLLAATIATVIGLRLLVGLGGHPSYFAVYISFSLIELLADLLFWVLIADYFTTIKHEFTAGKTELYRHPYPFWFKLQAAIASLTLIPLYNLLEKFLLFQAINSLTDG